MHIKNFKKFLCISLKNCYNDLLDPITHNATVLGPSHTESTHDATRLPLPL